MLLSNICHLYPEEVLRSSFLCFPDVWQVRSLRRELLLRRYLRERLLSWQELRCCEAYFVVDRHDLIINLCVEDFRNESGSDTLDLVRTAFPSESTGEVAGSTATILMSGFCSLRYSPVPVSVPPVPTPATKMSTFPSVSFQISGPVVALCAAGFARVYELSRDVAVRDFFGKFVCFGDRTFHSLGSLCQNQFCAVCFQDVSTFNTHSLRHSEDDSVSFAAAMDARPIPVLPLVGR